MPTEHEYINKLWNSWSNMNRYMSTHSQEWMFTQLEMMHEVTRKDKHMLWKHTVWPPPCMCFQILPCIAHNDVNTVQWISVAKDFYSAPSDKETLHCSPCRVKCEQPSVMLSGQQLSPLQKRSYCKGEMWQGLNQPGMLFMREVKCF